MSTRPDPGVLTILCILPWPSRHRHHRVHDLFQALISVKHKDGRGTRWLRLACHPDLHHAFFMPRAAAWLLSKYLYLTRYLHTLSVCPVTSRTFVLASQKCRGRPSCAAQQPAGCTSIDGLQLLMTRLVNYSPREQETVLSTGQRGPGAQPGSLTPASSLDLRPVPLEPGTAAVPAVTQPVPTAPGPGSGAEAKEPQGHTGTWGAAGCRWQRTLHPVKLSSSFWRAWLLEFQTL